MITAAPPSLKMLTIREIADKLGIHDDHLEYYGKYTAKLRLELLDDSPAARHGKLILVTAITEADTRKIHWFVDEDYVGESSSGETFFWKPKQGRFVVRAVDDHGRAARREVAARIVE